VGKDREPLLKDRTKAEPSRRQPDIVVCTSASGHMADAKPERRAA
jgi:hypothetical protein